MPISRSFGNTPSERYLKRLCDRSFLSMWSYTGIYNDKGKGQEICDLLVVFDNSIVIFSDKDIQFPLSNTIETNWKRWYKKAISESVKQVFGAERWILNHRDRLFLDQACNVRFPLSLPTTEELKVHRVVVVHSIAEHCRNHFSGGSGSLLYDSECINDEQPFTIGDVSLGRGFVHVLDDTSLNIVLKTLDTAPDLIDYLEKKEMFLRSGITVAATGEEELLGHYLEQVDHKNEHGFMIGVDLDGIDRILLEEGYWAGFSQHPRRKLQVSANRVSYFWDELIEKISNNVVEGNIHVPLESSFDKNEKLLRLLAKENRTKRRFLSESFLDFVRASSTQFRATRKIIPDGEEGPYYLFLTLPFDESGNYNAYRELRREMLSTYCAVLKHDHPEACDVIGIGTESGLSGGRSYDLVHLDVRNWTNSDFKRIGKVKAAMTKAGFLAKQRRFESKLYEYPQTPGRTKVNAIAANKGRYRNELCTCGSGRKSKKCCAAACQ
jgi:hypothetical protein